MRCRRLPAGKSVDPAKLRLAELEGTRTAVSSLAGLSGVTMPPVEQLDRELETAREPGAVDCCSCGYPSRTQDFGRLVRAEM
jgi:hypothetical protein